MLFKNLILKFLNLKRKGLKMCPAKKLPAGFENKVDLFLKQINEIQKKCEHRFFLSGVYKPKETLERGTFRVEKGIMACCLDCSKEVYVDMTEMCPRCFGEMAKQKDRKDSVDQLYSCKKCDFTVHQINRAKLNGILSA